MPEVKPYTDHPLGWGYYAWDVDPEENPRTILARRTHRKKWNGTCTPDPRRTPPYRTICALRTGGGGGTENQRRYWARCGLWSVPIYEILQKVVDGTATADDIAKAKLYCDKVSGNGAFPRE